MDQRREDRFQTDQQVQVTVLEPPGQPFPARIRDASGRGMGISSAVEMKPGYPIKINLPNSILLGEVIFIRADGDGWFAGVELEHALFGLAELAEVLREVRHKDSQLQHPDSLENANCQNRQ